MTTLKTLTIVAAGGTSLAMVQASAATKHHHHVTHVHPAIYNMVPDSIGAVFRQMAAHLAVTKVPLHPDSW